MRAAFALRIISGKNIYNFAILENLRSLKALLGLSLLHKRGLVEKYRAARIYSP